MEIPVSANIQTTSITLTYPYLLGFYCQQSFLVLLNSSYFILIVMGGRFNETIQVERHLNVSDTNTILKLERVSNFGIQPTHSNQEVLLIEVIFNVRWDKTRFPLQQLNRDSVERHAPFFERKTTHIRPVNQEMQTQSE